MSQSSAVCKYAPSLCLARREAYYWLRHNTKPDAKIMSWWGSVAERIFEGGQL
jgi:hypothetical protein